MNTKYQPMAPSTFLAWRDAWAEDALFSEAAVRDLQSRIGPHHFFVVLTRTFKGEPSSLVFQSRVSPETMSELNTSDGLGRGVGGYFGAIEFRDGEAICLRSDDPIISMQGEKRCSFSEALAHAEGLAQWCNCHVIYTYDDSIHGRA